MRNINIRGYNCEQAAYLSSVMIDSPLQTSEMMIADVRALIGLGEQQVVELGL